MRRTLAFGFSIALAACGGPGKKSSGPVVARGKGIDITADDFQARLDEQSPFMRARYDNPDRKKEFLDNLVRFEVLAAEAKRQKLDQDPDVQQTLKKVMVQKLLQTKFPDPKDAPPQVSEVEARKFYEEHESEYRRPRRLRVGAVIFQSDAGTPDRVQDAAAAKSAYARLLVEERKSPLAFSQVVNEVSEDGATRASGGDLGFKTLDELSAAFSPEVAATIAALASGQTSEVLETAKGVYIFKLLGSQEELDRGFEQVKEQIVNELTREKRTRELDEFVKKLTGEAGITIDEKALDAVRVATAPAAPVPPASK